MVVETRSRRAEIDERQDMAEEARERWSGRRRDGRRCLVVSAFIHIRVRHDESTIEVEFERVSSEPE